jgi:hypothetical protein
MMMRDRCSRCCDWSLLACLMLIGLSVSALTAADLSDHTGRDDAYGAVLPALTASTNRLPGSTGYATALAAVEQELRQAGMDPQRLGYSTLVPRTVACEFSVDGRALPGVLALAPNGAVPPTTWGRALTGPVMWLGNGTLTEMQGLPVAGAIACVRMGCPNLPEIFAQGAIAVVAVGDDATQWQTARMFSEAPVASPRAWIPQAEAQAAGLLENPPASGTGKLRQGSLRLTVTWQDAEASDLWVMIPAATDAPAESRQQTLVLAAELATSGAVPERCPGGRQAANAALLTEVAVRLWRERPARNVLVTFLGSHYAGQDGARVLYYVINKALRGGKDTDQPATRSTWANAQIAVCDERLRVLAAAEPLTAGGDVSAWIGNELRRIIGATVNDLNFQARSLNLARKALTDRTSSSDPAALADIDHRLAVVAQQLDVQGQLRRQVHERRVTDPVAFSVLARLLEHEVTSLRDWLVAERDRLASWERLKTALDGQQVSAHFGFDFANAMDKWFANPFGLDCETVGGMQPGHFSKHLDAYQQAWNRVAAGLPSAPALRGPDLSATYGFDNLEAPGRRQVACVVPLGLGLMASQLVTLGDPLDRDEMPRDVLPDLRPLATPVTAWLAEVARTELPAKTGLPTSVYYDDKLVWRWEGSRWAGLRADRLAKGSEEVDGPAAGGVLFVRKGLQLANGSFPPCGRSNSPMARINPAGFVFAPTVNDNWTRARVNALDFSPEGAPEGYFDGATSTDAMAFNIRLFTGYGNAIYTPFTPSDYGLSGFLTRLTGASDSTPKRIFGELGTAGAVVVTNENRTLKLLANGLFLLGTDGGKGGYNPDPLSLLTLDTVRRSAEDTAALNQGRLAILRSKDLINRPVERLHADCRDHLESAQEAREQGDVRTAAAHETVAAALAYRAHDPLRENANDLLRAVVILLVMSIPFAFALERLAIGAVSIYRQIGGFLAVFIATFLVLYFSHPAFALANSPLIIFLAFVIILLSGFVIMVVMGKFKQELKALQGLSSRAHSTGTANSTTFAAIIIGIAGMRNRPLKTFLTVMTVTLLTFTILAFASFQSGMAVVETYLGRSRDVDRIEVHQPSFLRIPDRLVESVEALHSAHCEVFQRTASFNDPLAGERPQANVLLDPTTGRAVKLDALLGIDAKEARHLPALAKLFASGSTAPATGTDDPLWLSEAVASRWKLQPGAVVSIRGHCFVLAGTFPEDQLRAVENIDGTKLTPPDFDATFAAAGQNLRANNFSQAMQSIDTSTFVFASPSLTAITTNAAVRELGGATTVLTLYPKSGADLGRIASDIAESFNGPVYVTTGAGAKRYFFTREVTGGGYLDLLVPLLLGGLIIFSSLLGSIVDRQKEIFTYSALGLSPRDVGTLFFAESAVIAILGGMGGYLLGQLVAKILNLLSSHGLVTVPDLNFSSLSSLVTIFIVMAMVMLSTIYPALLASRSANPGVNRAWKMPKPDGDTLTFTFPFTVPEASFGGIVAFVREHFHNHGDAALDVFAAKQVGLFRVDDLRVGIRAEIALSPFDLGVYQRFAMRTRPSDIAGIDEVVVEIERLNGSANTWLRGNRSFVADLREQFLIWRSLPPEAVAHYQSEAARIIALPAEEDTDGQG